MTAAIEVLDDDGVDVLELALVDALAPPVGASNLDETVYTDRENTPLARWRPSPDGGRLEPLQPVAHHGGPAWDPALRLAPAAARDRARDATALVIDDLPTRGDLDRAARLVAGDGAPVLIVVLASRGRARGGVGVDGLTRAAVAFATALREHAAGRDVVPVVVPWPRRQGGVIPGWPAPDLHDVLRRYGASRVSVVADLRPDDERTRIDALRAARDEPVHDLYPDASAAELLRATAVASGGPGAVVLFTGLSGSGKSTIARALAAHLEDRGGRRVTLLDGDVVRRHLSAELGFDAVSRERNVERIGWVAALLAGHGGIAIAAPIAPFASSRAKVRDMATTEGAFVLVWVSTPLAVCEARDRKGLYARARAGEVRDFTGISSPYEPPSDADVVIDTSLTSVEDAVAAIRSALDAGLRD